MSAKNMNQLNTMLLKEMRKAMEISSQKTLSDMYEETEGFYSQGKPKMYERTGALGDTPRTTSLNISGNNISFKAYLDDKHRYTTGTKPYMSEVLEAANKGTAVEGENPMLGKSGFWERAEKKMERSLDETMKLFFNKE